uniref:Transposase Tc1-like domain-containing protein n=1 Tax=Acrobeloides nanus TaxID=290746 RepID=A0A914DYF0_9BILA
MKGQKTLCSRRDSNPRGLSKKTQKKRYKFAVEHQNWTVKDWKKILWSDESKKNRISSDGIAHVHRPINS